MPSEPTEPAEPGLPEWPPCCRSGKIHRRKRKAKPRAAQHRSLQCPPIYKESEQSKLHGDTVYSCVIDGHFTLPYFVVGLVQHRDLAQSRNQLARGFWAMGASLILFRGRDP